MYRRPKVEGDISFKHRINILGTFLVVSVAVGIFYFGVIVGQGKVSFNRNPSFGKSVTKNLPANLDYSAVEKLYDTLRVGYDGQLDSAKLLDGLKAGLVSATGDPYTEFLNADSAKEFKNELSGSFTGIGAELGKDANNNIVIITPIAGFPADKSGLKARDIITEIDGKNTFNLTITEAVNKIRGPSDSMVKLKILRGLKQELVFDIKRATITIPSVKSEILAGNIGYLQITRFSDDTANLVQEVANNFKKSNVNGIVLDLRGDPGGLLDAAVKVSSLWLNNKTVLSERRGGVVTKTFGSTGMATLEGIKTVVLIDEGSASASEIVAGALHDNKAAQLIGEKSYGKGSVQQLQPLDGDGILKVTIARWYTPAGKNIDKEGIKPDQTVKRTDDDIKNNKDPQKDAAIQFLKSN